MSTLDELHTRALRYYQAGEHGQAEQVCATILQREPLNADAIHLLGAVALETGTPRAVALLHHATLLRPANAAFHHALGEAYRTRGDRAEAIKCFREALRCDPALAAAHHGLGQTLLDQGDLDEALTSIRQSVALQPNQPRAQLNLGRALSLRGDLPGAAACFTEAVRLKPDYAIAHNNLGAVLHSQQKYSEAISALRRALQLQPNYPEAHFNLGNALHAIGEPAAVPCYAEAIRLRPDYLKAHCQMAVALAAQGRTDEAVLSLKTALRLKPDSLEALEQLGYILLQPARWEESLPVFQQVLARQPDHAEVFACLVRVHELLCDWRTREADFDRLRRDVEQRLADGRRPAVLPFNTMTQPWSPVKHLAVARSYSEDFVRRVAALRGSTSFTFPRSRDGRLRIGYICGAFHNHALMHLMQGLFGLHDRNDFEVFAYSYGPDDDSSYRHRVKRDCDHFRDVAALSTADAARCIHADGVHILVDLMGYTGGAREEIVALRPAPIQVSWIGYAGSMGAPFLDYFIGDAVVTPPDLAEAFSERIVQMPHCYLINDHAQEIAAAAPRRTDYGLPENGFVFTSFNNSYKYEPRIFGIWMRVLQKTPDAVLWLYSGGATMERNLWREAAARGVSTEQIVFAKHQPKSQHLARLRLADLFLDTHYVNAHTGASDALWTGLPVLTCPGETFASRVAASLLTNVGLPELIATDLDEYERRAVHLACHPEELRRLRERLAANRTVWPLFDTPRFTRNLERAYRAMWDVYAAGQPPRRIEVTEPAGDRVPSAITGRFC
jgi:protein O-GlcNAc transferase